MAIKKSKKRKKQLTKKIFSTKILNILIAFIFFIFLLANISYSQNISPLYWKLVNDEKQAVIDYLKKIKPLPFFKTELKKFTTIFGKKIVDDVFFEDEQRKIKIKKLEAVLQKNPKSRDVLYALSKLYQEDGNERLAKEYFKKAKEVDPNLTIAIK
jgi:tetratricopeptide (TPR) repeat protein